MTTGLKKNKKILTWSELLRLVCAISYTNIFLIFVDYQQSKFQNREREITMEVWNLKPSCSKMASNILTQFIPKQQLGHLLAITLKHVPLKKSHLILNLYTNVSKVTLGSMICKLLHG